MGPRAKLLCLVFLIVTSTVNPYIKQICQIGQILLKSLLDKKYSSSELIETQNVKRMLQFDKYKERTSTQIIAGLDINHFDDVINDVANEYSIPEKYRKSLLRGKHAEFNEKVIKEFLFDIGEPGKFVYGKIMMMKQNGGEKIDIAFVFYTLNFQLSQVRREQRLERSFLTELITGVKYKTTFEDRKLSDYEKNSMLAYLRERAVEEILDAYPQLITYEETSKKAAKERRDEL